MPREFVKDPNAVLDYQIDWSAWLATGDTISTSTWVVPSGITEDSASSTTTTTTIWLSGGTVDQDYSIVNRITTEGARTDDRTILVRVRSR